MRVVVALCALCACASASLQLVTLGSSDLRADFPILHQKVWDGRQLVYLDSAATSQKPKVSGKTPRRTTTLDHNPRSAITQLEPYPTATTPYPTPPYPHPTPTLPHPTLPQPQCDHR